jgi:rubrerythrin
MIQGSPSDLKETDLEKCIKEIYPGDEQFEIEIKAQPDQFDFYRMAMDKEQKSIDFYKSILEKSQKDEEKKILHFLIDQERKHFKLFDEMSQMLRSGDEWVEAPEFGIRKLIYNNPKLLGVTAYSYWVQGIPIILQEVFRKFYNR